MVPTFNKFIMLKIYYPTIFAMSAFGVYLNKCQPFSRHSLQLSSALSSVYMLFIDYIANIMDSDQTAPLVERAHMLKVFWNASEHVADIIKRQLFHDDKTY